MRVEGHTDSTPIKSDKYPSNWELSGARASSVVRYMISRFKFSPSLFTAIGYADTRPLESSYAPTDPKNRRVEILILKNSYKNSYETKSVTPLSLSKAEQERIQKQRQQIITQVENDSISPAARKLLEENRQRMVAKQKSEKLSEKNMELYVSIDKEHRSEAESEMPDIEKRVIKLKSNMPEDEDFGI